MVRLKTCQIVFKIFIGFEDKIMKIRVMCGYMPIINVVDELHFYKDLCAFLFKNKMHRIACFLKSSPSKLSDMTKHGELKKEIKSHTHSNLFKQNTTGERESG